MSRDIKIILSEEELNSIKDWTPYYHNEQNVDIEITI